MLHIETVKLRWQLTGMELVREALKRAKQRGMTYKIILMITRNLRKKLNLTIIEIYIASVNRRIYVPNILLGLCPYKIFGNNYNHLVNHCSKYLNLTNKYNKFVSKKYYST